MPVRLHQLLKAAGDQTRLRILNLLARGNICVCDLQALLGSPQPTISRHLAALRHVSLVRDSRNGPRVVYSLVPPGKPQLKAFYEFLDTASAHDALLQADLRSLERAVREGRCRVEPSGTS